MPKIMTAIAAASFAFLAASANAEVKAFKSLAEFNQCAADSSYDTGYCLPALEAFAKKNPRQNFEIGKAARLKFQSWVALRFFEPGLGAKPTPAQCGDEQLALAVNSGLALPPDYPGFASAKKIFEGPCFSALLPVVQKELAASSGGYDISNVCPILAARKISMPACAPKVEEAPIPVVEERLAKIDRVGAAVGLIKVYKGPEGQKFTIGELSAHTDYVLIRMDGISGAYAGKTLLHKRVLSGERIEYWTEVDGKRWSTISGRVRSGYADLSAFVPGVNGEIAIGYSETESKTASAASLTK